MRGKGSGERRIKLLKPSRLLNPSLNGPTGFAFGRPDTNNVRKITRTLYYFKNNFPYEADHIENEHKSHESLKKNSDI